MQSMLSIFSLPCESRIPSLVYLSRAGAGGLNHGTAWGVAFRENEWIETRFDIHAPHLHDPQGAFDIKTFFEQAKFDHASDRL